MIKSYLITYTAQHKHNVQVIKLQYDYSTDQVLQYLIERQVLTTETRIQLPDTLDQLKRSTANNLLQHNKANKANIQFTYLLTLT